jgi:hypothetical protein
MMLKSSHISCGVIQLVSVGQDDYTNELAPTQENYDRVMASEVFPRSKECAFIIASLTSKQTMAIDLLKRNGFEQIGNFEKNPNSDNIIALFVKRIRKNNG